MKRAEAASKEQQDRPIKLQTRVDNIFLQLLHLGNNS
jgi:hypothetical protein